MKSRVIVVRLNLTSVPRLFDRQRRLDPNAVAVSFGVGRVTYEQLDERANQIAYALRQAGVAEETLVGLYLERSPELIASLLGVWKAGGAYLPIDPTNPRQRVAFTLEDSGVKYVLTQRSLAESLPPTDATIVCLEDICAFGEFAPAFVPSEPSPDQLAYVIYTSGSTGQPKGAQVCHAGLANVVQAIGRDLALNPGDVALATATVAFDISCNSRQYADRDHAGTVEPLWPDRDVDLRDQRTRGAERQDDYPWLSDRQCDDPCPR
jgi:non-ribosomal peptide synthetase component F